MQALPGQSQVLQRLSNLPSAETTPNCRQRESGVTVQGFKRRLEAPSEELPSPSAMLHTSLHFRAPLHNRTSCMAILQADHKGKHESRRLPPSKRLSVLHAVTRHSWNMPWEQCLPQTCVTLCWRRPCAWSAFNQQISECDLEKSAPSARLLLKAGPGNSGSRCTREPHLWADQQTADNEYPQDSRIAMQSAVAPLKEGKGMMPQAEGQQGRPG